MASKAPGSDFCLEVENSTDCLLRYPITLLEEQKKAKDAEFNWDPVALAFTVPIAVVAALFTFITILQGLAAGGKGHRKSNRQAIGEWSARTRSSWSWREPIPSAATSFRVPLSYILGIRSDYSPLPGEDDPMNYVLPALRETMEKCHRICKSATDVNSLRGLLDGRGDDNIFDDMLV